MTDHPITPPPELVHQWHKEACKDPCNGSTFFESKTLKHIATQAARWGADQELEACCRHISNWFATPEFRMTELRTARRPKPPSLKDKALLQLDTLNADLAMHGLGCDLSQIRRALEGLPE